MAEAWLVPEGADPGMLDKLWHTNLHWGRVDHERLEVKVYHCCDNGNGIQWDSNICGWTVSGNTDLELYIDVE